MNVGQAGMGVPVLTPRSMPGTHVRIISGLVLRQIRPQQEMPRGKIGKSGMKRVTFKNKRQFSFQTESSYVFYFLPWC